MSVEGRSGAGDPDEATGATAAGASLARSSAVMAAGTVVSRVLGMVRASLQTAVVGSALAAANGWELANTLPNTVFLLLAGGVLNAVLVPQITRATSHADGGREYVDRLLTLATAAMAVLTVLFTIAAPLLVRLYGGGYAEATLELSTKFALICLPQIFFYGLYTLLGQVLNARGQFAAYMWSPVVANVVAITGLGIFFASQPVKAPLEAWTPTMIWLLAGSATAGVVAQAAILVLPLWRSGFRYRPRWGLRGVGLRTASRVAMWTFAALAVSQVAFIATTQVLSSVETDSPGRYSYGQAFLLFMLPHSLVTVSLVTALFTRMSRAAHADDLPEVRSDIRRGLRLSAVATVPSTIGGIVLGFAITATLYLGNDRSETRGIALMMMAMLLGLIPFGVLYLMQRVFYAFEDAKTPFRLQVIVSAVATVANLASLLLPDAWIGVGVGLGQTLSNLAGAVVGLLWARRRLRGLPMYDVVRTYVRLTLAAVVAGGVAAGLVWGLSHVVHGKAQGPVVLVVAGGAFGAVYFALARRMRVAEVDELLGPLVSRARRILPGH